LYRLGINAECLDGKYDQIHQNDKLLLNARNCHIASMVSGAVAMLLVLTECLKCNILCGKLLESIVFFIAWTQGLAVFMIFGMEGCGRYFIAEDIQGQLDNMTSVAELLERMDTNPKSDFSMNANIRSKVGSFERAGLNMTQLFPDFIDSVPLGTNCEWGSGATFNLIASLLYLGCGFLLCFTPKANPIYGTQKEADTGRVHTSGATKLSQNEDLALATTSDGGDNPAWSQNMVSNTTDGSGVGKNPVMKANIV